MNNLTPESLLQLAIQAPILLIFAYIMIRVFGLIKDIISQFLKYLTDQRELDRKQSSESMNRLEQEIKDINTDTIRELTELVNKVDGLIDKIREIRNASS